MDCNHGTERFETVIIGGGQAGLATGYHLARLGRSFVILEADRRVGDAWRKRWDSLHLFTPARRDGLPGRKFPAKGWSFPSRDNVADYLEAYAACFRLPVRTGMLVDRVTSHSDRGYLVTAAGRSFLADNVVVATGAYQIARRPARPGHRAVALQRVPRPIAAAGRQRPGGRRGEFRCRDRA